MLMERLKQPYVVYLIVISLMGGLITAIGLFNIPTYQPVIHFLLFLVLAVCAQFVTSSFPVSQNAGITYQVAPAVTMAVIPFFGPFAASVIDAISAVSLWIIKPIDQTNWKKSWRQLAFNTGMGSIAAFLAGLTFVFFRDLLGETIAGAILPWLIAAVVNDQVNLWLLIGIIWFQHKRRVLPMTIWKENIWAVPISILLMSVGGALLAFSLDRFGPIGLAVFFLPVLLSAIAFRFYVQKKQAYMDNLEQMVHERTKELEELNKRKDAFLAVLTHDMITPLTTMRLCAELIREDPTTPAEDPEFIETMIRSQKHLHRLLQNILDLERLNTGEELPVRESHFDLISLLVGMIDMVEVEAKEKNIVIESQVCVDSLILYADQNQTERILLNLLSNAVKYTPVNGRIFVSSIVEASNARIEVSDTGYGISEQEMPYIFQRFNRVRQLKDKATGTGLGLAITKALVEAHGGQIFAESQEGRGSTFTVLLPLEENISRRSFDEKQKSLNH